MERESRRLWTSSAEHTRPRLLQAQMVQVKLPPMALKYPQIYKNLSLADHRRRPPRAQQHLLRRKRPQEKQNNPKKRARRKMHRWMKRVMHQWRIPRRGKNKMEKEQRTRKSRKETEERRTRSSAKPTNRSTSPLHISPRFLSLLYYSVAHHLAPSKMTASALACLLNGQDKLQFPHGFSWGY